MWRFVTGASPPPAKKLKSREEKLQTQRLYDQEKRDRGFVDSWSKQFGWLVYDSKQNKMRCSVCCKYDPESTYGEAGTSNFKIQAIKKHNASESHVKFMAINNAKISKPGTSKGEKTIQMLNASAFQKLSLLFRNAHYVAKTGRPYTDYVKLCKLDKAKGLDVGDTYITDKYCQKFVSAIAAVTRQKQDETIESCQFISLISDGSTDTSSKEAEIVLVRTSLKCQVSTHLIGIKNVSKADSSNICQAISTLMTEFYGDSWRGKVVAFGCDGASVMLGNKNGVVQKLREELDNPHIHAIHCSAHRLELAYKDAVKKLPTTTHQKCDSLLLNLYLFYKYSSLNRANLMQSYESLGLKSKVPTRVGGTRWLPHTKLALTNLLHGYEAIIQHLEQLQNPCDPAHRKDSASKGKAFLKLLKDQNMLLWLHFLLDVVVCLAMASEAIQKQNATLGDIWNELESAKATLQKYKHSSGPHLKKLLKKHEELEMVMKQSREVFLCELIQCIAARFDGDLHLFRGSSFLDFNNWPQQFNEEIADYGDRDIDDIIKVIEPALKGASVEVESIEPEWTRFKTELYNSKKKIQSLAWSELHEIMSSKYPNLLTMVTYLLCLPSSSVDAERGFSRMKMVKNDWRSRLGDRHLSDLLIIDTSSPSVSDFDPEPAIHLWNTSGVRKRRPYYRDANKPVQVDDVVVVEEDAEEGAEVVSDDVYIMAEQLQANTNSSDCEDSDVGVADDDDDDDYNEHIENNRDILQMQQKAYKMMMQLM